MAPSSINRTQASGAAPSSLAADAAATPRLESDMTAFSVAGAAALSQFATLTRFGNSSSNAVSAAEQARLGSEALREQFFRKGRLDFLPHGRVADDLGYRESARAIREKAVQLGYGDMVQSVPIRSVAGGYVGRFGGHDIYAASPAHEVHGDIRAKYDAVGGPSNLGLPLTDEMVTPDQVGRFNHFERGSIYWTPRTGPMIVRGAVRDRWAASGWERGPLGYPVRDQHRMGTFAPTPNIEWCIFENGAIAADDRSALPVPMRFQTETETLGRIAPPALLTFSQVASLFAARINAQFQASPNNVGLRPGVTLTGVSEYQLGFWTATPRTLGFRLRGFHDNGLAPDTGFTMDFRLRFELIWDMTFTEPTNKTLIAWLDFFTVGHDGGLPIAQIYSEVEKGILRAFYVFAGHEGPHDPAHPQVPSGAVFVADVPTGANATSGVIDILDIIVTAAGDLQLLVNPLTPLRDPLSETSWTFLRQLGAQRVLDGLT